MVAIVGLYGLVAYNVLQRTHEVGIRMAVGAHRNDVLKLILRQGMQVAIVGESVGLAMVLLSRRLLGSVLYGVSPFDIWAVTIAVFAMTLVSLLASYIPAHRATKVEPMVALRTQ